MARPKQDGLLYFSFDTDFFYADKRIKRLHTKFENDGLIFYIYLLTEIYRNGYYIRWDEEFAEDVAADLHLKEGFIEQVLTFLRTRSLLTVSILATGDTIITSPGIQRRYQEAVKSRRREVYVNSEIWLLSKNETATYIKVIQNQNKSCGNESKSCRNESKSCGNDTKESKGKERKEKQRACVHMVDDFVSVYPKKCNRHQTEIAYIQLIGDGVETEENLVIAAQNYADACRILGTQERYIKNAENFLRDFAFEEYLPGKYKKPERGKKGGFNDFSQNSYNFEQLEKEIVSN